MRKADPCIFITRMKSPIPNFRRNADTMLHYLRKGGGVTPMEATMLAAYAHRLIAMLNRRNKQENKKAF